LLKKSPAVKAYEVLDFKQGKNFYFLKVKAKLVDGSEFYIGEFVSESADEFRNLFEVVKLAEHL